MRPPSIGDLSVRESDVLTLTNCIVLDAFVFCLVIGKFTAPS